MTRDSPSVKAAARIVGQYYGDHQVRLFSHLVIVVMTAGFWGLWFLAVLAQVYSGTSEDTRIGAYMCENGYDKYINQDNTPESLDGYDDWNEKKTHPDESPNIVDSISAVVNSFPKYYQERPFIAVFHLGLIILTGGIFLLYYPARVMWLWFGSPVGPRTQKCLEEKGYVFTDEMTGS